MAYSRNTCANSEPDETDEHKLMLAPPENSTYIRVFEFPPGGEEIKKTHRGKCDNTDLTYLHRIINEDGYWPQGSHDLGSRDFKNSGKLM